MTDPRIAQLAKAQRYEYQKLQRELVARLVLGMTPNAHGDTSGRQQDLDMAAALLDAAIMARTEALLEAVREIVREEIEGHDKTQPTVVQQAFRITELGR